MPGASYIQSSFVGGLVSKFTQGRYHDQHYRTWLETCLNGFPVETEAWVRRPGFGLAGSTRQGLLARAIKFDFQASAPYTMEFSDGFLRFWQANVLATTNDSVILSSISAANPAVLTLSSAVSWATGDEVYLTGLGATCPTLQNRRFTVTKNDTTHFSIADAVTQTGINGSGVGTPAATALVNHVLEIATPYTGRQWQAPTMRFVQTEITGFLLNAVTPPYQLSVTHTPSQNMFGTFSLAPSFFEDGPYLDPIPDSILTASAVTGIITLTASVPAYSATTAYTIGEFVLSSSVTYESLADANVNNTPASSPTFWQVVSAGAPINGGQGFLASDIGRLVRLFSEPAAWAVGTTYAAGNVVSYNPSGLPGQSTYWQSLTAGNTGNIPGTDIKNWQLLAPGGQISSIKGVTQTAVAGQLTVNPSTPVIWTWGKITAISAVGAISGTLAGSTNIGNLTSGAGLTAAFDGNTSKGLNASAFSGFSSGGSQAYIGKNYTGAAAQTIAQAVIYPNNQYGFENHFDNTNGNYTDNRTITVSLRAKSTAPANAGDGSLLGSATTTGNSLSPLTIISSDKVSTWNYVWIQFSVLPPIPSGPSSPITRVSAAQVIFYTASAVPGTAVSCEILGPPLLYSGIPILTWQLGVYSNTTGWPTVGTYSDGRLWLAGAIPNRFDACVADGINGIGNGNTLGSVNFAPTDQYGNVLASSGISYVLNSPDVNPILWMTPDHQGILMGTISGEWLLTAPTAGGISPLNIAARRMTKIGSANIEPVKTEHTVAFVQRYTRNLIEFFADVFSGKFTAPNLAKDAKQLTIGNIQEIAYQQVLAPVIWARVNNGLIGTTYKRDTLMTSSGPTINAWHQHTLGSSRQIESIAVGSAANGTLDALTIISNDPNANVRFVEVLSPILDEGTLQSAAQYLDAAIAPSSSSAVAISNPNFPYGGLQLNGLWLLNGYSVTAWLGGLDLGDYAVANGSISVPFGDGIGGGAGSFPAGSGANRNDQGLFTAAFVATGITANGVTMWAVTMPMLVGFTYASQGRIVRPNTPAESGARSGPAFGKKRRSHWLMAQFEGSQGVLWGTRFDLTLKPVRFTHDNGKAYTVDQQFSGIVRDNLSADYTFDNQPCWQVTRPYICNVQTIGAALETQDI